MDLVDSFFTEMTRDSDPNKQLIQYILASLFLVCHGSRDSKEIMLFRDPLEI